MHPPSYLRYSVHAGSRRSLVVQGLNKSRIYRISKLSVLFCITDEGLDDLSRPLGLLGAISYS